MTNDETSAHANNSKSLTRQVEPALQKNRRIHVRRLPELATKLERLNYFD